MGIFQQFPYTNFHEMNLDEILKMVKDSNNKISDVYNALYTNLKTYVFEWLDEHPDVIDYALIADMCDTIISNALGDIQYDIGKTDKDIYTIITIPKSKFKMKLTPICDDPADHAPIKKYVLEQKPAICMNITNDGNLLYNGVIYGSDYTQSVHGSIYAMKDDDVDFEVFENPTKLSDVRDLGYKNAISAWNCLRKGGVNKSLDWSYASYANPNPRQTLAWDDDNWYIYTSYCRLAIYGDNSTENLYGITMQEARDFCENKGWPNAAALDGGGSSYIATGSPFVEITPNINNGYLRDAYMCIAFERGE